MVHPQAINIIVTPLVLLNIPTRDFQFWMFFLKIIQQIQDGWNHIINQITTAHVNIDWYVAMVTDSNYGIQIEHLLSLNLWLLGQNTLTANFHFTSNQSHRKYQEKDNSFHLPSPYFVALFSRFNSTSV